MQRAKKSKADIQKLVGRQCRTFRRLKMGITLHEMSDKTGIPIKTLSGFEHGRSSNMYHFYIYLTFLTENQISDILNNIINESGV